MELESMTKYAGNRNLITTKLININENTNDDRSEKTNKHRRITSKTM